MNHPSQSSVGGSYAVKYSDKRVPHQEKVFNSASEALDAYIAAYEKRTSLYTRRPSDLIAPKPKFYFMDSLERSLLGTSGKSPGQKVDDLVAWVNQTYNENVRSSVQPFGGRGTTEQPHGPGRDSVSRETRSQPSFYSSPMRRADIDELSSLPSASSSIVDLDSNAGTVETDILLSSYKGPKPDDKYSRSNIYSPPKTRSPVAYPKPSQQSPQRSSGTFEYPSWVSHLGKEYPSWVEDLDNTVLSKRSSQSPQPKFTSTAVKSYSDSNLYKMDRNVTPRKNELRLSDLKPNSHSKSKATKSHLSRVKDSLVSAKEWTDTASMDTDILVAQSVYGQRPINMGGDLHKTLYEDHKVNRIKKESSRKLRKSSEKSRSRARERIGNTRTASPQSKSVVYTPERTTQPLSPRGYHSVPPKSRGELERDSSPSRYKDLSPLRSGDHSHSMERLELRPNQFTMPIRKPNFQSTEISARDGRPSHRMQSNYVSPEATQSSRSRSYDESHSRSARNLTPPSHAKSMIKQSHKLNQPHKEGGTSDTDREMRKSPTGIRMEKIYREPATMYPWKTMIQSQKSVAFSDDYTNTPGKPVYESTPIIRKDDSNKSKHLHEIKPKESVAEFVTQYSPKISLELQRIPKHPIFTSTEKKHSVHHKPPIVPRGSQKRGRHKRSQTMPDLRKIASQAHHTRSRRSYDDDMLSIVTSDTEVLVTQPSMPIVDVSPSLTTVSDSSDTIVGSDTELEREVLAHDQDANTSITVNNKRNTIDPRIGVSQDDKFSPTSVFASSSPYAAVREELPKRYHLWKLDDDTKAPDSFIRKRHVSGDKTNIISSFLEDCLNVDDDSYDHNKNRIQSSSSYPSSSRLSGRESATGPKEALKNMLFTMQDMANHDDETPRSIDNRRVHFKKNLIPADDADSLDDDHSDTSSQLFHGEESLQRAYHHLQRLKRLVGSEDEQSSVASEF